MDGISPNLTTTFLPQDIGAFKRKTATSWAERGFKVLRLPPDKKSPPLSEGWQNLPANTPDQIRSLWTGEGDSPEKYNIAIQTGAGFVVLDFDERHGGKDSLESLAPLLDDTLVVRSPGGWHYYYSHAAPMTNGADVLKHKGFPGVDLRGQNGYVVAAGSSTDDGRYDVLHDRPMAPLPPSLCDLIGPRTPSDPAPQRPIVELDRPDGIELAEKWLSSRESIDGQTYAAGARMKDFGLSPETAIDMLTKHEQQFGAISDRHAMERSIRNAFDYATNDPPGVEVAKLAHHEFPPLSDEDLAALNGPPPESDSRETARKSPFRLERGDQLDGPATKWLIDKLVPAGGLAAVFGEPGTYKSFVALHLCACVADQRPFLGAATKPDPAKPDVVYIAAEGGYGLADRVDALSTYHGIDKRKMVFLRAAIDLRSTRAHAEGLVKAIRASNLKPAMVVVDTLARTFGGGNENSSEDMGEFLGVVDACIRDELGCAVLLVHHSGKDSAKGMRGHSSLFGAVDAELELERIEKVAPDGSTPGAGRLKVSKQKDGPDGWSLDFAVERVDLGSRESRGIDGAGGSAGGSAGGAAAPGDFEPRSSLIIREWASGEARPGAGKWDTGSLGQLHQRLKLGDGRVDQRSPAWAGHIIGEHLGLDTTKQGKPLVARIIAYLVKVGALKTVENMDGSRRSRQFFIPAVEPGLEWQDAYETAESLLAPV